MIKARMRGGVSWSDVHIVNLSLHGLGINVKDPPGRGAYVEVCRGEQVIIARVAWTDGHRAGLRAQDPIFIQALMGTQHPQSSASHGTSKGTIERRRVARTAGQQHQASRYLGRSVEFAGLALLAASLSIMALGAIKRALVQPLSEIEAALL